MVDDEMEKGREIVNRTIKKYIPLFKESKDLDLVFWLDDKFAKAVLALSKQDDEFVNRDK